MAEAGVQGRQQVRWLRCRRHHVCMQTLPTLPRTCDILLLAVSSCHDSRCKSLQQRQARQPSWLYIPLLVITSQ